MSSSTTKVCFNFLCKQASDKWRRGWRRLTGEYADLCDRCASAYEDGKFCETFHLNAAGWRCCESCGNQIHCGCIVSFHMFVLLDAGGIECLTCAEKSYILTPNPAWPPPSHCLPSIPERMKDLSSKTWNPIAGSGPVPWHQAPSLFSSSHIQSNVQRMPLEINVPGGTNMYRICDKLVTASPETKQENICERLVNGKLRTGPFETSLDDSIEIRLKEQPYCHGNDVKPVLPRMGLSSTWNMAISSSKNEANVVRFTSILSEPSAVSTPMYKQIWNYSPVGLRCESQISNGQARGGSQCQYQLNPRHHPQITDAELRQILRQSKSVAIPLFEKMLSASDAGRIGRLILPKRCAEAFFPYISQPEGMPLKVQDMNGKEWVFQFRFWLNCHSRMYVLEGITPCIQSMQLKAGDVVTFGWMEPEGKLVMGGRKASVIQSSDQVDETIVGVDASTPCDDSGGSKLANAISVSGHMGEKVLEDKFIIPSKRKNPSFYAKRKRRKIENLNLIELKLNYKEVQGLMRPPRNVVPTIVVVEGCEFEEFGEEDGPVIGRPTILGVDHKGVKTQWVQCEICLKWRRVPADALLPSRWICSENAWDPNRSQCSAAEELTNELLQHMFSTQKKDSSRIDEVARHATNRLASEQGLHALANLAIKGETEHFPASSGDTSKLHLRHKSGCLCIICGCLQRRFKTLLDKREREQLAEASSQNLVAIDGNIPNSFDEHSAGESSTPPLKGQIDLNIQPGREEELLPGTGSGGPVKCPLSESNGRFLYLH